MEKDLVWLVGGIFLILVIPTTLNKQLFIKCYDNWSPDHWVVGQKSAVVCI
jgi:hypothetical protein